ncbi:MULTISPECIES: AbiV family abortive infection protein [Luteimonas]|uniref:AbiV family abortive infection protein n=1 Tax=Luteimonas TaxID=83614 RepID=UPI000C79B1B6|nr:MULTISPECIES: AbiV family abortive infection protein [Luteimonas]
MAITRYWGEMSVSEIAIGMASIASNARRLLRDARSLHASSAYSSAIALSILSVEESGKSFFLRKMLIADNAREFKDLWKGFRTHTLKNKNLHFADLLASEEVDVDRFVARLLNPGTASTNFENIKQLGLYADCYQTTGWHSPHDEASDVSEFLLASAERLLIDPPTEEELELHARHFRQAKLSGNTVDALTKAVHCIREEAAQRGLRSGEPRGMDLSKIGDRLA